MSNDLQFPFKWNQYIHLTLCMFVSKIFMCFFWYSAGCLQNQWPHRKRKCHRTGNILLPCTSSWTGTTLLSVVNRYLYGGSSWILVTHYHKKIGLIGTISLINRLVQQTTYWLFYLSSDPLSILWWPVGLCVWRTTYNIFIISAYLSELTYHSVMVVVPKLYLFSHDLEGGMR